MSDSKNNAESLALIEQVAGMLRDATAGVNDRGTLTIPKADVLAAANSVYGVTQAMMEQVSTAQAGMRDAATLLAAEEAARNVEAAVAAGNTVASAAPGIVVLRGPDSITKVTVHAEKKYPNPQSKDGTPVIVNGQVAIRVDTARGSNPAVAKMAEAMIKKAGGIA